MMFMTSAILAAIRWEMPAMAPTAVAAFALLLAGVLWLYPPQLRRRSRLARWSLPALRTLAAVAVVASLLRPVVVRPKPPGEQQGAVVLLIDGSRSMGVIDRGRTKADLVALAAGLGLLPAEKRVEAAPGLRAKLETVQALIEQSSRARSETEYAKLSGRGGAEAGVRVTDVTASLAASLRALTLSPPGASAAPANTANAANAGALPQRLAELRATPARVDEASLALLKQRASAAIEALDTFQSQTDEQLYQSDPSVREICDQLDGESREELVADGLRSPGGLLATLPGAAPIYTFRFGQRLSPLPGITAGHWPQGRWIDASDDASDITGAVREAARRLRGKAMQAMIVLSDGRQVGPEADAAVVEAANVPIFGVPIFAARAPRRDVAIARIVSPEALLAGESAVVRVELSSAGLRGAEVEVQLSTGGAAQTQRIVIGEDGSASAEFPVRFERSGVQRVEASVAPQPGEAVQENNRAWRRVKVSAERARVTLIGDFADKETAAVREALAREPWVRLEEAPLASATNAPPQPAGIDAETLESQNVIVLRDVGVSQLSEQQWTAITRMVNDRGGSVILCAGEEHWPGEYADYAPAARLLPYDASVMPTWRTWPGDRPTFRIAAASATANAGTGGAAGAEADLADRAAPWAPLPPVARFMPIPRSQSAAAAARALLVERSSGAAVLTEAGVGAGRAFVLGTDETWRWSTGNGAGGGASASAAFWPRLVRRALREPYAGHAGNLSLDADPIAPQPGQTTHIRARVLSADGTPMTQATWPLIISRGGGEVRRVMMSAGVAPGRYDTTLSDLAEGEYTLRVEPPTDSSQEISVADALEIPLYVESTSEAELTDVSGDETLLRRLADASGGGQLVLPEQLSSLPQRLAELRAGQNEFARYPLWDSPYLYALVVASLSAEWALRKRWGLA